MKIIGLMVSATLAMTCLADATERVPAAWPKGKDPVEVGRRLIERFLSRTPDDWNAHHSQWALGKQIAYPTACVWDGAFQFAAAIGDQALARRVAEVYTPFYDKDAHLIPPAVHVDYTMFGGIPLAVYAVTGDRRALATGLAMADAQWAKPKADAKDINGMAKPAGQLAYWTDGYTPQTRLWIDDMFMISFVQLAAYRATGKRLYAARVAKEMALYLDRLQNPDGLFYHAPDVPFAWGRGNGWMAVGMTLVLKDLPKDDPNRGRIVEGYRKMMATLLKNQRADGLWGQLVDDAQSWPETSGSGMFAYAFIEGARNGSLEPAYGEAGRRAYLALVDYLTPEGDIREVCVGTNKRNDRAYYLARPRRTGDHHGQAPLLWCCAALAATGESRGSIGEALAKGGAFLLGKQAADGHWGDGQMPALTALPVWALTGGAAAFSADVKAKASEAIKRGVDYVLSTQRPDGGFYVPKPGRGGSGLGNYNTSVCLSSLFDTGLAPKSALLKARSYIASSQLTGDDTMAGGFGYDKVSRRRYADLSNTSYAMDAMARTASLEEFRTDGGKADLDWAKAIGFVERLMAKSGADAGGATYNARTPQGGTTTNRQGTVHLRAYGSMTYAAVLSMCSAKLDRGDPRVRQSLEYLTQHWTVDENPGMGSQGLYYFYDIMARALSAARVEDVGGHKWKSELSAKVMSLQKSDGSWFNDNNRFWEADPVLCTSFAMLVLELCR